MWMYLEKKRQKLKKGDIWYAFLPRAVTMARIKILDISKATVLVDPVDLPDVPSKYFIMDINFVKNISEYKADNLPE